VRNYKGTNMAISPNNKHDSCEVYVQLGPTQILRKDGQWINHYASLVCRDHSTWIQWLGQRDTVQLESLGIPVRDSKLMTKDHLGELNEL